MEMSNPKTTTPINEHPLLAERMTDTERAALMQSELGQYLYPWARPYLLLYRAGKRDGVRLLGADDPEPTDLAGVLDCDGDAWIFDQISWRKADCRDWSKTWDDLRQYEPLLGFVNAEPLRAWENWSGE